MGSFFTCMQGPIEPYVNHYLYYHDSWPQALVEARSTSMITLNLVVCTSMISNYVLGTQKRDDGQERSSSIQSTVLYTNTDTTIIYKYRYKIHCTWYYIHIYVDTSIILQDTDIDTLYIIHYTLYIIHYTLYIIHYTLYTQRRACKYVCMYVLCM